MTAPAAATSVFEPIPIPQLRDRLADLLVEYRAALDANDRTNSKAWVHKLLELLGWGLGDAKLRQHRQVAAAGGETEILECDLFGYDAFKVAVLPLGDDASWETRAAQAVAYLYNHGEEWAVVSDFERLEIVNVRWTDKQHVYLPFRRLVSDEYVREAHTLALLTPARIRDRDLFQQGAVEAPRKAFDRARPGERTLRPPITKVVLDQLLASRAAFLHDPPEGQIDPDAYDEQIHRLLTRLIFIRACEDMQLRVSEPLRGLLGGGHTFADLERILADYRALYNSELFDEIDLQAFRWNLVLEAVHSLYRAPDVIEFNFAAIEADILGMMYEDYLQWRAVRVVDEDAADQRVLFELKRVATENVKRERGIFYTPAFLVDAMVEGALDLIGASSGPDAEGEPLLVTDLACGSGAFLAAAFARIVLLEQQSTYQKSAVLLQRSIAGCDIDPRAVEATRLNLWLTLFRLHPHVHPLPRLASAVFARDTLLGPLVVDRSRSGPGEVQQGFFAGSEQSNASLPTFARRPDIILGNPPFVSIQRLDPEYRRKLHDEGYSTATGRYDLANIFVERALDTVREGGIVALVVPNRVFTTAAAASLRELIAERADIERVIDFGTQQVFAATTYVSVVFLRRKWEARRSRTSAVPIIRVDEFFEPRGLQLREALAGIEGTPGIRTYTVRFPRTGDPVLLVPGRVSGLIGRLRTQGVPVKDLANVTQGIKLGAQGLYLVAERTDVPSSDDSVRVRSFEEVGGRLITARLERAALRPAVHTGEIQRYRTPRPDLWLIYPYEHGRLIPFAEYAARFPETAAYLSQHRALLTRRVTSAAESWHGLARPREVQWLRAQKILVPQLATEGRMTLDSEGRYLVQGFSIRPHSDDDMELLLGTLNSTLLVWLTALNAPKYRGNNFEYQGGVIESLPIPRGLLDNHELRAEITNLVRQLIKEHSNTSDHATAERIVRLEAQLDALVYEAAELRATEISFVEEEVARFRPKIPIDRAEDLLTALDAIRASRVL